MSDAAARILARASERVGTTLRGKYRLDSVLGAGGMAVVYRATHRNRAEFAVKMLLRELSSDDETRARFLREGYAANSVKHPGAVLVVDDDVSEDGTAFLVMELLSGVGVEDLIERSGQILPAAIVAMIGWQLLDVLAAAHAAGVIHRDIKPANLFLTTQGTVKVLDFGIARVRDVASLGAHATRSGSSFGTPAYMSPEQALGKTGELDHRTDIWSAGATMFTALSGQLVHDAPTPEQVFISAATKPARPLASVMASVPAPLAAVIDTALAYQAEKRWSSAAQMRDALGEAFRSSFGSAMPDLAELVALAARYKARPPSPALVKAPHHSTTMPVAAKTADGSLRSTHRPLAVGALAGLLTFMIGAFVFLRPLVMARGHRAEIVPTSAEIAGPARPPDAPSSIASIASASVPAVPATQPMESALAIAPISPIATSLPPLRAHATHAALQRPEASSEPHGGACVPPYTLDADGNKHFKPECFSQ